jgi:hypothetical protein
MMLASEGERIMTFLTCRSGVLAGLLAFAPVVALAQTVAGADWQHGTTIVGFVGAASPASHTGPAAGATLGWEVTPRFAIEGRGVWLDAGPDSHAFAATLGARIPLLPVRRVMPYVTGGVGMYRASFERPDLSMPHFYGRRLAPADATRSRAFQDFAVAFGGGADFFLSPHVAVRPDLTVLLVTTRSDTAAVPVYGVQLAYHFESHPWSFRVPRWGSRR